MEQLMLSMDVISKDTARSFRDALLDKMEEQVSVRYPQASFQRSLPSDGYRPSKVMEMANFAACKDDLVRLWEQFLYEFEKWLKNFRFGLEVSSVGVEIELERVNRMEVKVCITHNVSYEYPF